MEMFVLRVILQKKYEWIFHWGTVMLTAMYCLDFDTTSKQVKDLRPYGRALLVMGQIVDQRQSLT